MTGHKHDKGKARMDLLVPEAELAEARVLTHGAAMHGEYNWQQVEKKRYIAAIKRHIAAYQSGEVHDPDTGEHHMAHVRCNAAFLFWFDEVGDKQCE